MVSPFAPVQKQINARFPPPTHPYRTLERAVLEHVTPNSTVLDIGCGRTAPNLRQLIGKAKRLVGIDVVDLDTSATDVVLHKADVCSMTFLEDGSVDLAYSRSVMEHLEHPDRALREMHRVLRKNGRYIFLTPSFFDYGSLISHLTPNRAHPSIVRFVEGRDEADVFPTFYRANTRRAITSLADASGLRIVDFAYVGQYPAYFAFNRVLFWLASVYQKAIQSVPVLHPLQGWIFCILQK